MQAATHAQDSLFERATIAEAEGRYIGFVEMNVYKTYNQIVGFAEDPDEDLYWVPWIGSREDGMDWVRSHADDFPISYGSRRWGLNWSNRTQSKS
jgi:hypothetical protein